MKKIFGILLLSCVCILLGLSVKWGRESKLTLVSTYDISGMCCNML